MDTCYCVFWFPTIFHRRKKSLFRPEKESKIPPVSIADEDNESNLLLEIIEEKTQNPCSSSQIPIGATVFSEEAYLLEEEERYDLIFRLTDQDGKMFDTRFRCENQTRNGFVVYSYDRAALINNYWNRFDENEQTKLIEKVRQIRVIDRIKKKYSAVETNPDDELIKNYIIDRILISFYHHAKQFYHEHETHSDSDGKYISYYYSEENKDGQRKYLRQPPSLSTKNNPVINWYIDQFEKQLVGNAQIISKHYKEWSLEFKKALGLKRRVDRALIENNNDEVLYLIGEIQSRNQDPQFEQGGNEPPETLEIEEIGRTIDNPKEFLSKLYRDSIASHINSLYDSLDALSKECTDSLIEYTYCKTLLESKYNDDYKHGSVFLEPDLIKITKSPRAHLDLLRKDFRRKKAFNIRNSIRYIEDIKQKCDFLGIRITEMLIEEVHGISNENENILGKITELTTANNDVLKDIRSLTNANKAVLDTVQTLTSANNSVLGDVQKLTNANTEVLNEIKSLTSSNNNVLDRLQILSTANSNLLGNIEKLTIETAKSNGLNSFLGWIALSIAIVSLAGLSPDNYKLKWICFSAAIIVFLVFYVILQVIVPRIKNKNKSQSKKEETIPDVCYKNPNSDANQ